MPISNSLESTNQQWRMRHSSAPSGPSRRKSILRLFGNVAFTCPIFPSARRHSPFAFNFCRIPPNGDVRTQVWCRNSEDRASNNQNYWELTFSNFVVLHVLENSIIWKNCSQEVQHHGSVFGSSGIHRRETLQLGGSAGKPSPYSPENHRLSGIVRYPQHSRLTSPLSMFSRFVLNISLDRDDLDLSLTRSNILNEMFAKLTLYDLYTRDTVEHQNVSFEREISLVGISDFTNHW